MAVFILAAPCTVEIVISEQWSWKVAWFLKEYYCPARNHTTFHDHVLLVTFSTVDLTPRTTTENLLLGPWNMCSRSKGRNMSIPLRMNGLRSDHPHSVLTFVAHMSGTSSARERGTIASESAISFTDRERERTQKQTSASANLRSSYHQTLGILCYFWEFFSEIS